jgi:SAM-dependent methyltransferase
LVHLALPSLLALALPLAFSSQLGLVHLPFPDQSIALWGGDLVPASPFLFARNLLIFLVLFCGVVAVFVGCGAPLGYLFPRLPTLQAYAADLTGSLVGVLLFTLAAWLGTGPAVWLAMGCLPFIWLTRSFRALAVAAIIVGLGHYSARYAVFSPYNRIDEFIQVVPIGNTTFSSRMIHVNRDFHQLLLNLSDEELTGRTQEDILHRFRRLYDLPFVVNQERRSALIVGAGTGNDVAAAIRNGYQSVTGVEIDSEIIAIGRAQQPGQPYSNPRVRIVVADARAFFERERGTQYDVVCYGLLDSHAMSSAMSTLRLDNFVYTEDGIRAAWQHVADGGHLSLAMSCAAGGWLYERLYWTIAKATRRQPLSFYCKELHDTVTFLVPRGAQLDPRELANAGPIYPMVGVDQTVTTSDDWPFLYMRPHIFPWGYLMIMGAVLVLATATIRPAFDLGAKGTTFDLPMFVMGAAFLLIETRGVTSMSLLFGSTWAVNAAIFSGILIMVLLGNLAVLRWHWHEPRPWFWVLFAAVALLILFPIDRLQTLSLPVRGVAGGLLTGLPVGLAGIIVSMLLKRSRQPTASLGANLLGAVVGGCLEYYSMFGGLRSTAFLALALYLVAFLLVRREMVLVPSGAPMGSTGQAERGQAGMALR